MKRHTICVICDTVGLIGGLVRRKVNNFLVELLCVSCSYVQKKINIFSATWKSTANGWLRFAKEISWSKIHYNCERYENI